MILAFEAVADTIPVVAGATALGTFAFLVNLIVKFQRDFTNRYAKEIREQDANIVRLRGEITQLRAEHAQEMTAEQVHRRSCEADLAKQGRLLESVMVRLEQLDRRKTPPRPDVDR